MSVNSIIYSKLNDFWKYFLHLTFIFILETKKTCCIYKYDYMIINDSSSSYALT